MGVSHCTFTQIREDEVCGDPRYGYKFRGGYYGGLRRGYGGVRYYGKRSADADAAPVADAYGGRYRGGYRGYGGYGGYRGYRGYYGKRDAEPEPARGYRRYGGYRGYRGYRGYGYRGYYG